MYQTTLRIYSENDKKLVLSLKQQFNCNSMSKNLIHVVREYFYIKKELENIKTILKKNLQAKYELPKNVMDQILASKY